MGPADSRSRPTTALRLHGDETRRLLRSAASSIRPSSLRACARFTQTCRKSGSPKRSPATPNRSADSTNSTPRASAIRFAPGPPAIEARLPRRGRYTLFRRDASPCEKPRAAFLSGLVSAARDQVARFSPDREFRPAALAARSQRKCGRRFLRPRNRRGPSKLGDPAYCRSICRRPRQYGVRADVIPKRIRMREPKPMPKKNDDAALKKPNRYSALIVTIFKNHHKRGRRNSSFASGIRRARQVAQHRASQEPGRPHLFVPIPKRFPPEIVDTEGRERGSGSSSRPGRARYRFRLAKLARIIPRPTSIAIKIPDATPEIIAAYALTR